MIYIDSLSKSYHDKYIFSDASHLNKIGSDLLLKPFLNFLEVNNLLKNN